jgi:hypothetical protein
MHSTSEVRHERLELTLAPKCARSMRRALLLASSLSLGLAASAFAKEDTPRKASPPRPIPPEIQVVFREAKASAAAGRGLAGARCVLQIASAAEQAGNTHRFAEACKVLSHISEVAPGEAFPPAIQFHIARGHHLRGLRDRSLAGFKAVFRAATTPDERREWIPRAAGEVGQRLFAQERYLEAALAYETVVCEFPEHELAQTHLRYAISAMKRTAEQFGEEKGPFTDRLAQLSSKAATPGIPSPGLEAFRAGVREQTRRQWLLAVKAYRRVPETATRSGLYANAMANAGYCYTRAHKATPSPAYVSAARATLLKAIEASETSGRADLQAFARVHLAELELKHDPGAALATLTPFDGPLEQSSRAVRARWLQVKATLNLGGPNAGLDAEAYFGRVEHRSQDPAYRNLLYAMIKGLRVLARREGKRPGGELLSATWRRRAADFAQRLLVHSPALRPAVRLYLARVIKEGA